jgi:steroid 5-alpha reductase family enzyme
MTDIQLLGVAGIAILVYMTLIWMASLIRRDASGVDTFWGPGFVVAASVYFRFSDGFGPRKLLLIALVAIWGVRLAVHIFMRNAGQGEDKRYQAWRMENPKNFWWISYFRVFLLQGVLMLIVSTPLLATQTSSSPDELTVSDWLGCAIWIVGFAFETIGDLQLARFKADPANKDKILRAGLWRYSRHPNYFGEAVLWWGYFVIALGAGGLWTVYSPILMTFLLLRVSGVTLLEKSLTASKPGYKEYIESTSAFIPWSPRKSISP